MAGRKQFEDFAKVFESIDGVSATYNDDAGDMNAVFEGKSPKSLRVSMEVSTLKNKFELLSIEIEGVDLNICNNTELRNADEFEPFIEAAKSALTGDVVFYRSPLLKKKEVCFKYHDAWICIPVSHWFKTHTFRKSIH